MYATILKMMEIKFKYTDGDEELLNLTEDQARNELMSFLNRFSDAGKRQWMAKMKKIDKYTYPFSDEHYEQFAKRFLEAQ